MSAAPDAGEPQQGSLLGGRYRLGRLIGRCGMGSVYEATHEDLRRRVAVKLLDPRIASDPAQIERFRREALSAAKLGHPNIVTVTDFQWPAGEPPFLVMEYLTGESLGTLIERSGALPPARVALIAAQVLDALGAAHAAGMIHRDIKPDNVFLTSMSGVDDVAKVLDFGIAKGAVPDAAQLTASSAMVGTPAYMSPEQTRGLSLDLRADIYAVGALMYHALTGELPFRGPTVPAMIVAIATTPTPAVIATRPAAPRWQCGLRARLERRRPARHGCPCPDRRSGGAVGRGCPRGDPASICGVGSRCGRAVAGRKTLLGLRGTRHRSEFQRLYELRLDDL